MALGYHLATQIAERCETEARYRLLADNASDAIICVNSKGHRSYVSPSFCGMTGWTQEELVGMSRHDLIAPEDHMAVNTGLDRLSPGDPPFTEQYRQVTRSGKPMWVEMRASAVTTEFEGVLEYILNIRDITQQKLAEDELAEANAELSAISLNDALTGIANRRNFDQTLRREWNRAKRGGHSLALLMVDADQFKAYNDRYGHVMGDDCLKVIAKRLAGSVQRAGDFVARYGGEEFAVILPDMLVENASIVAERMRKAFLEETRLHDGNEPGIVTVSIGVTAIVPGRAMEETVLLELADKALYQAKHEGRNRVVALKPIREVPRVASAEASQDPLPIVLAMPA
jgi:diguanylate cyclase (GGDEF)-like protein/PAS domain S-box-containing protein